MPSQKPFLRQLARPHLKPMADNYLIINHLNNYYPLFLYANQTIKY